MTNLSSSWKKEMTRYVWPDEILKSYENTSMFQAAGLYSQINSLKPSDTYMRQ